MRKPLKYFIDILIIITAAAVTFYAVHLIRFADHQPGWDSIGDFVKGYILIFLIGIPLAIAASVKIVWYMIAAIKYIRNKIG